MIEKILLLMITYAIIEITLELITQIFKVIKKINKLKDLLNLLELITKFLVSSFIVFYYLYISGLIQLLHDL